MSGKVATSFQNASFALHLPLTVAMRYSTAPVCALCLQTYDAKLQVDAGYILDEISGGHEGWRISQIQVIRKFRRVPLGCRREVSWHDKVLSLSLLRAPVAS